jgi:hypothetical protein
MSHRRRQPAEFNTGTIDLNSWIHEVGGGREKKAESRQRQYVWRFPKMVNSSPDVHVTCDRRRF